MNESVTTPDTEATGRLLAQAANGVRVAIVTLRAAIDSNNLDVIEAALTQLAVAGARLEQGAAAAGHQLRVVGKDLEVWVALTAIGRGFEGKVETGRADAGTSLIWWCPRGLQPELAAIQVPAGSRLEDQDWSLELENRVQELVDKEPDPDRAAMWAARALGLPGLQSALDAGEVLVRHNLELQTAMSVDILEEAFPAEVLVEDEAIRQAAEETDLESWVNMALAQVSTSSLD
ncbi:MAG: hypothetical protein WCT47_02905 [Betaproteobacteria bacterium]|jgi:hypothetical protein